METASKYSKQETVNNVASVASTSQPSGRKTFVISDLHLGHSNIIRYCSRPFSSAEEMDAALVKNWNDVVSNDDTVYYLGDLAFGRGTMHFTEEYAQILKGKIICIKGNHYDPKEAVSGPVRLDYTYGIEGRRVGHFLLCHDPETVLPSTTGAEIDSSQRDVGGSNPEEGRDYWLIHGHHHNHYPDIFPFINGKTKTVNVSVEVIGYKPLDMDYLCKLLFESGVKWMVTL